jgi:hypothetical protein
MVDLFCLLILLIIIVKEFPVMMKFFIIVKPLRKRTIWMRAWITRYMVKYGIHYTNRSSESRRIRLRRRRGGLLEGQFAGNTVENVEFFFFFFACYTTTTTAGGGWSRLLEKNNDAFEIFSIRI